MKELLLFKSLLITLSSFAQKEADHWVFGVRVGLNFNNNYPNVFKSRVGSQMEMSRATAVISDKSTGELLFYTDGFTVWNSSHSVMTGGTGLRGVESAIGRAVIQSIIIVPVPGTPSQFYLFYLHNNDSISPDFMELYFSRIDMEYNDGLGRVVETSKNVLVANELALKITAIPHSNGTDFWLITHGMNNNNFYVHAITQEGVSSPVVIPIGTTYVYEERGQNLSGAIKASPNGKHLAVSTSSSIPRPFELFDFDPATGEITNARSLGDFSTQYGVSFSPDNTKLYLKALNDRDVTHQFDLLEENVAGSRVGMYVENPLFPGLGGRPTSSMELAPDGKIYIGGGTSEEKPGVSFEESLKGLVVIHNPNMKGVAANVEEVELPLQEDQLVWISLPNFIQNTFNGLMPANNPNAPCNDEIGIDLYPNPAENYITLEVAERCFSAYTLTFYNTTGQRLGEHFVDQQEFGPIDVQSFKRGLYFAVLEFADRRIVKRFVKL